jgi:hypothetical protein
MPAEELWKLKKAIRDSGFSVLQASNCWSIVDVSEKAERECEEERRIINENIDMSLAIKKALSLIKDKTSPVLGQIREILQGFIS